jgi:hypothetical protein
MFSAPGLVFGSTEGVGSCFHVLRTRTHFRRYLGRQVQFSYFARSDSFAAVPRVSGPVFMFSAPGLGFGGTNGVGHRFHVLRSRTRFRRYRWRRVPFSCLAGPDSFSAVPRASGTVFVFYAPGLIFDGTEGFVSRFHVLRAKNRFRRTDGVGSRFHVFRSRTRFRLYRGRRVPFHILRARTRFRRYGWRRVPFECYARSDSFSAVPRVSGPVFMFCLPSLICGGTESAGSRFHVLRARTHFRRYRGRRAPFSCFALPDSFSAVPMALGPVFMFSGP